MTSEAVDKAALLLGGAARRDVPIGPLTTYRVGGAASLYLEIAGEADLELACRAVAASGVAVLVVGRGSNLLVGDGGFEGLAVRLGEAYSGVSFLEGTARAGGGLSYPVLARRSVAAGLTGMEWAVGIPGSVGGAVAMNAGGHGAETKDRLLSARCLWLSGGGEPAEVGPAELEFSYRSSAIGSADLVLEATFSLSEDRSEAPARRLSEIVRWRRENQPGGQNAGSVFTNPPGASAGELVESVGMKGFRLKSAAVSEKHANFIQADENGSADDVRQLIDVVRQAVSERAGVELAVEVRLVGTRAGKSG